MQQTPPIRIEHQPSLGAELVFQRNEPPVTPPLVRVPPDASLAVNIFYLSALVAEVRGLRADLASRTLAARWRRVTAWVRRVWHSWRG